jgi:hypothetical protein
MTRAHSHAPGAGVNFGKVTAALTVGTKIRLQRGAPMRDSESSETVGASQHNSRQGERPLKRVRFGVLVVVPQRPWSAVGAALAVTNGQKYAFTPTPLVTLDPAGTNGNY